MLANQPLVAATTDNASILRYLLNNVTQQHVQHSLVVRQTTRRRAPVRACCHHVRSVDQCMTLEVADIARRFTCRLQCILSIRKTSSSTRSREKEDRLSYRRLKQNSGGNCVGGGQPAGIANSVLE